MSISAFLSSEVEIVEISVHLKSKNALCYSIYSALVYLSALGLMFCVILCVCLSVCKYTDYFLSVQHSFCWEVDFVRLCGTGRLWGGCGTDVGRVGGEPLLSRN